MHAHCAGCSKRSFMQLIGCCKRLRQKVFWCPVALPCYSVASLIELTMYVPFKQRVSFLLFLQQSTYILNLYILFLLQSFIEVNIHFIFIYGVHTWLFYRSQHKSYIYATLHDGNFIVVHTHFRFMQHFMLPVLQKSADILFLYPALMLAVL